MHLNIYFVKADEKLIKWMLCLHFHFHRYFIWINKFVFKQNKVHKIHQLCLSGCESSLGLSVQWALFLRAISGGMNIQHSIDYHFAPSLLNGSSLHGWRHCPKPDLKWLLFDQPLKGLCSECPSSWQQTIHCMYSSAQLRVMLFQGSVF